MKLFWKEATSKEYYDAKRRVTEKTVKRLFRGNINAQNGNSCSTTRLDEKSNDADAWMAKTQRAVEAAE